MVAYSYKTNGIHHVALPESLTTLMYNKNLVFTFESYKIYKHVKSYYGPNSLLNKNVYFHNSTLFKVIST